MESSSALRRIRVLTATLLPVPTSGIEPIEGKTVPRFDVLQEFISDPDWQGKPFWMLNVLRFRNEGKGEAEYKKYGQSMIQETLPGIGARLVFQAYARTVIGKKDYHAVAIVEYPSPQAFMEMIFAMAKSPGSKEKVQHRLQGLEEQYLIPIKAGWLRHDSKPSQTENAVTRFTQENVCAIPSGIIGSSIPGSRVGETSASDDRARALVADEKFGGKSCIWCLNLYCFQKGSVQANYRKYAEAVGRRGGIFDQWNARCTKATTCYRSLIGDVDFDQAVFAEFPTRDTFLSMGASKEYMDASEFRHASIDETYAIACLPNSILH